MVTLDQDHLLEVALRLRRRHLRSYLQAWRRAERRLKAARRSRSQRARFLLLARRHGLHRCLDRLHVTGMTVDSGYRRHSFYYEPACVRINLMALQVQAGEFRQNFRSFREQPPDSTIANLKALLEDSEIVQETTLRVRWVLPDLYLDDVLIGDLEVTLDLEVFKVQVLNVSADTELRGGYQHPHVDHRGEICWNNHEEMAQAYHREGDFLALRDLIDNLLHTYNPSSPYINLEDWEYGLGEACYECGERYHEDDLVYVDAISGSLCPNCRAWCEKCEDYVREEDYSHSWEMCEWCFERHTGLCRDCQKRFLVEDLHPVEITDGDQSETLEFCEDCYTEFRERKEKSENEDCDDPESLLAPAMALPAD